MPAVLEDEVAEALRIGVFGLCNPRVEPSSLDAGPRRRVAGWSNRFHDLRAADGGSRPVRLPWRN